MSFADGVSRTAVAQFLTSLERAVTAPEKERLLHRFAATLDTVFYDLPAAPATREGNALERDVQALLEAIFSVLQIQVPPEHRVEPPPRFAALRALGAFVQGAAPVPTVLSQDWAQPHTPLYLAALRLLTNLFERGTTQYVFAIRCLSVLALQALQVLVPLDPVDCAVSTILSSPARGTLVSPSAVHDVSQDVPVGTATSETDGGAAAQAEGAAEGESQNNHAKNSRNAHVNSAVTTAKSTVPQEQQLSPAGAPDAIMQAPAAASSPTGAVVVSSVTLPNGTPLRVMPVVGRPPMALAPLGDESSGLLAAAAALDASAAGSGTAAGGGAASIDTTAVGGAGAADDDVSAAQQHHNDADDQQSLSSPPTARSFLNFESLFMDHLLSDPILRPLVVDLWRQWDTAGIDVRVFTACPEAIHVYFPTRLLSSVSCVYRDFVTCPERPKMEKPWSGQCEVHIKTNIPAHSDVMYRLLIEGYNYGVNRPIQSEVVGCARRSWDEPGGGDAEVARRMCHDYAGGCVSSQYFASDGCLVVKLTAKSFFGVGFTASAWMVFHGHSPGFPIEAEVFHQEEDL